MKLLLYQMLSEQYYESAGREFESLQARHSMQGVTLMALTPFFLPRANDGLFSVSRFNSSPYSHSTPWHVFAC